MSFHTDKFWSAFSGAGMLDQATYQPPVGGIVIFDVGFKRPDQVVLDGMVHTTDYSIEYRSTDVELKRGAIVSVEGVQFKLRQTPAGNGDGEFVTAALEKVLP